MGWELAAKGENELNRNGANAIGLGLGELQCAQTNQDNSEIEKGWHS